MPACVIAAVCLLGVFAVSLPASGFAQAQQPRLHGHWFGGLGTASAKVNCEICANDRNGGLSGYLTGGLPVARGLRAGAEVAGWFDTTHEVKVARPLRRVALLEPAADRLDSPANREDGYQGRRGCGRADDRRRSELLSRWGARAELER